MTKLDLDMAQMDGRVVRVEGWMDTYFGKIADSMETLGVGAESKVTPELGEVNRVVEPMAASACPKVLGLREIN